MRFTRVVYTVVQTPAGTKSISAGRVAVDVENLLLRRRQENVRGADEIRRMRFAAVPDCR